jgi:6-phosphogluconate dehydrogenase
LEDVLTDPAAHDHAGAPDRSGAAGLGGAGLGGAGLGAVGLVGFGVMGRGLATNLLRHGADVVVMDPAADPDTVAATSAATAAGTIRPVPSLSELAAALPRPRRVLLMVPAGGTVDAVLAELGSVLDAGDVVIDGGNSHPQDTSRRVASLTAEGIHLIGAGVSGGEAGAAAGPSIMPGGDAAGWDVAGSLLRTMAAVGPDGAPCCDWIGPGGAGHLTKMVHNGIEYALMQTLAELVGLLRIDGASADEVAVLLRGLGADLVGGFLLDITADVLATRDEDGAPLVDKVLDVAAMKGTGGWTTVLGLELGRPVPTIAAAVLARSLSARLDERERFARLATSAGPGDAASDALGSDLSSDLSVTGADVRDALLATMVVAFAEGLDLLAAAAAAEGWRVDLARVVGLWRAGSIVQTHLLGPIGDAYRADPDLPTLLVDPGMVGLVDAAAPALRRCVIAAAQRGVAAPALSAALATVDGMRTVDGTGSVVQALRDRFGAHTFERRDRPRGERFHDAWQG